MRKRKEGAERRQVSKVIKKNFDYYFGSANIKLYYDIASILQIGLNYSAALDRQLATRKIIISNNFFCPTLLKLSISHGVDLYIEARASFLYR